MSTARPATPPSPGMQPMARPIRTPPNKMSSRAGSSSRCKAWNITLTVSGCMTSDGIRHSPVIIFSAALNPRRICRGSAAGSILQLIEPVETHGFHDAVADHDQPRFAAAVGIEMLVDGKRGNIDEIAPLPFIALRRCFPLVVELIEAIEL